MSNDVEAPNLDHLTSLIRLIREREQLYFSILPFISKNIQSSSNKLDQIGLFNRFLSEIKSDEKNLKSEEQNLYEMFWINKEGPHEGFYMRKNYKQISRLTLRLIQMLESSLQKSANTIFNNSGRLSLQFFRFKKLLHRITTAETINIKTYITTFLNYSINKFNRQIFKIQKYLFKLESGQDVNLKDLYNKDGSDVSCPEDNIKQKASTKKPQQAQTNQQKKDTIAQASSRASKAIKKGTSNRISLLKRKNQKKQPVHEQNQQPSSFIQKSKTATKLFKFYNFLELNKKQFMEDYIFEQTEQQTQKQRLLNSLLQRNKTINQQIKSFTDKNQVYLKNIALSTTVIPCLRHVSSDQEHDSRSMLGKNEQASGFKISMRKSFLISKRKSSFNLDNPSSSGISDNETGCTFFSKTIKNFSSKGKMSQSMPKSQKKTNRMYIVKAPILFQEQIIPQVHMSGQGKKDISSMLKGKEKKNESMRMRKRNNPIPLQKNAFLQTFRYQGSSK